MKLTFIGAGYVGLVSAAGFANKGHECTCIDIDGKKVESINKGIPPIYEKELEKLLEELVKKGKLTASSSYDSVKNADVVFICVGTPSRKDGSIDLSYIEQSAEKVGEELKKAEKFVIVAVKSTVVPGTTSGKVAPLLEKHSGKKAGQGFGIAMIPEFLKEGTALADFEHPDRIVIGVEDGKTGKLLEELHSNFNCELLLVKLSTAEMIKYASNSFLATKISFINQLANLCEKTGVDVDEVAKGMGMDKRIGSQFLKAGPGFGGSCFPKDVKALMAFSSENGVEPTLLEAVMEVNYLQPLRMIEIAEKELTLEKKQVAILGLAFKPETDDVRESPSIRLVEELERKGCKISAYDPKGMGNFKGKFPKINYCDSIESALKGAEACFIVTDWKEFKKPLQFYEGNMKHPLIIDARRILDPSTAKKAIYRAIGRV
ncbi:MAG: UDP-glucose/GDP-mannose dehydrogenase family protein [Candidatus Micrarchaeota archaeon]